MARLQRSKIEKKIEVTKQNNMTQQNQHIKPQIEEDEIDLIALAKTLWEGRRTIIKTTLIFMAIGLFVAIFSEKEYTASTTFVPQTSESKIGGSLGGLAAMAGINLGSIGGGSEISPDLYPQIINSIPFQKELLQTPLTIEGQDQKITYEEYYTNIYRPGLFGYVKKYTIGLPGLLIIAIKGKSSDVIGSGEKEPQILSITRDEHKLIEGLSKQISLNVNDKDGYVTVSTNMQEALASAELTRRAQDLLQQYIINFKIRRSTEHLIFIQDRYTEKEQEFKSKHQELARFRDYNQNTNSALAQTKLEQLQSEYDIAFSVFNELAKQLETQQIQVKEDTPVFTVINPATVPFEKSSPRRLVIIVLSIIIGFIIGAGKIIIIPFINKMKE